MSFDNLSSLMRTSESFSDLNAESNPLRGRASAPVGQVGAGGAVTPGVVGSNLGLTGKSAAKSTITTSEDATDSNKPFGLGNIAHSTGCHYVYFI